MHHAADSTSSRRALAGPRPARSRRTPAFRFVAAAISLAAALMTIGCASPPPPPVVEATAYQGPPVAMGSKNGEHVAIISAPTPGWVPSLDRVMDGPGARQVFISLREPNPAFLRAQVTVDQHVATTVPTREGVRVHVRTLRWDQEDLEDVPYVVAASAAGMGMDAPGGAAVEPARTDSEAR